MICSTHKVPINSGFDISNIEYKRYLQIIFFMILSFPSNHFKKP